MYRFWKIIKTSQMKSFLGEHEYRNGSSVTAGSQVWSVGSSRPSAANMHYPLVSGWTFPVALAPSATGLEAWVNRTPQKYR